MRKWTTLALAAMAPCLLGVNCDEDEDDSFRGISPDEFEEIVGAWSAAKDRMQESDPEDLDRTHGDPSHDIVATGSFEDDGDPWLAVLTAGNWPPPDVYSRFVAVEVRDAAGDVARVVTQRHDGVDEEYAEGLDIDDVTISYQEDGLAVLLPPEFQVDQYGVQAGMLQTPDGRYVEDIAGPFDAVGEDSPFPESAVAPRAER